MKQFLINLWNAQKNAELVRLYDRQLAGVSEVANRLTIERNQLKASLPSRDSKGRFKGKDQ